MQAQNGGGNFYNNYSSNSWNGRNNYSSNYKRGHNKLEKLNQKISSDPFEKVLYNQTESTASLTKEEVDEFRNKHEIKILTQGFDIKPVLEFSDTGFSKDILERLKSAGFVKPSPIQSQSWPIIMSGHDLIGIAETGSGKTLSFLLPSVVQIMAQPKVGMREGPIALVVAPTRELVEQIMEEAVKFCAGMRVAVFYGGTSKMQQLQRMKYGVEIVIACPGRLIDFIEQSSVSLRRVTYLVLDEADRMLDMGFELQIRKIVENIRRDRQTLLFSATWPKEVRKLAYDLCSNDAIHVQIGGAELKANSNIVQHIIIVPEDEKHARVIDLLRKEEAREANQRIIIFCETKKSCDKFTHDLRRNGFSALCIHGEKDQNERRHVLEEFRQGKINILCATDVASRGLDVKNVKIVINYDMPMQIEDYVHRIGRTGRAGAPGISYTFFCEKNKGLAKDLIGILEESRQVVPHELRSMVNFRGLSASNRHFNRKSYNFGQSRYNNSNYNFNRRYNYSDSNQTGRSNYNSSFSKSFNKV